jgi:integrase
MPLAIGPRAGRAGLWITGTVTPAGAASGVRIRRRAGSDDPRLAREEAAALEARILRDAHHGRRADTRGWGEAVISYLAHEARSLGTQALLIRLTRHFADTPLDQIGQAAVDEARAALLRPNARPSTVLRNVVAPIRAVLHHAALRGWCAPPRFRAPRQPAGRTICPTPAQVEQLRAAIAPQHRALITWLACTGCRRGETRALDWADVDLAAARARLHADTTKAGRARTVYLTPAAVAALASLPARQGPVFGDVDVRTAWRTACTRTGLKLRGVHDLRHAWASWHYALHRDLLLLRTEGGWASVSQVERYAHLMPAGHEPTIRRLWGLTPQRHQQRRTA